MDLLINFDDLKPNNKALKNLVKAFTRAGAPVATIDADGRAKRTAGVTYREVILTFVDNQKITLFFKQTGDIFQVKLNGSVVPLKNQGDQVKAVSELVQLLDAGRAKFQAKLARQKVVLPSSIKTAAPRMELKLQESAAALDADIAKAQARVAELKAELGESLDNIGAGSGDAPADESKALDALSDEEGAPADDADQDSKKEAEDTEAAEPEKQKSEA